MKKTLISLLTCLVACLGIATAQNSFNLPYAQFGIGTSDMPYNMPMATRMGGAVYTRSGNNYINPFNPASYGSIEKESFVFDMGFNIQLNTLRTGDKSLFDANGNVGYLAIGLPITRWWKMAAGLMPYSAADYESVSVQKDEAYGSMSTRYHGSGSVSEIFVGTAFNIPVGKSRSLQAGANMKYLTGHVYRAISYAFTDNTVTYWVDSRRLRETHVSNLLFDFGLQFRQTLGEDYALGVGLTYKPYQEMTVSDMALIYTYRASSEQLIDTIFPARGDDPTFQSLLEQPHTFGVGLSFERIKRWQVAADATFAAWDGLFYTEDAGHAIFGQSALEKGPYSRYALGFERMGDMDASTYWGRIGWSVGTHAEQGLLYLNLDDGSHRIDGWGVGAGMSMPMRKGRSLLTLSVGYNVTGDSDLLKRECVTFGIAVSSCERWFVKRKYN